jgi:hypothetical protein
MSRHMLDLSSDPNSFGKMGAAQNQIVQKNQNPQTHSGDENANDGPAKKFLGLKFTCCGLYSRVYVNRDGTAYEGRCPKCLKHVKLKIGEGGTDSRFFEVF